MKIKRIVSQKFIKALIEANKAIIKADIKIQKLNNCLK